MYLVNGLEDVSVYFDYILKNEHSLLNPLVPNAPRLYSLKI